ncbi:Patatin/Phospholipase A2-like protein [Apiospora saccharicola]|uniref:Patatin/Phospholipase A2-like protein n=1 Tax=Apiospora saccharicola TaxID=335842 RepID=A0ABR1U335_9PEZI
MGSFRFATDDRSTAFNDCTIWQVARATSAATTFFESIKLGRDKIEFIDAGLRYNNPCEDLIEIAPNPYPCNEEWPLTKITKSRTTQGGNVQHRVWWKDGAKTWEPYDNVKETRALEEYESSRGSAAQRKE